MPPVKISAMPVATYPLTGLEIFPVVQGGVNAQADINHVVSLASGGPTWITPAAGQLTWHNVANTYAFSLGDNGQLNTTYKAGSQWVMNNGGATLSNMVWSAGGISWNIGASLQWAVTIAAGGNIAWGGVFNTLTESGFSGYSRGFITSTPGSWGGPGSPTDLETAVDRIAAAVAGLLGGGIP